MDVPAQASTSTPPQSGTVSFHHERLTDIWDQVHPLAEQHYAETSGHRGKGLSLSLVRYAELEATGQHRFDTIRIGGKLIGYCSTFVTTGLTDGIKQAHEDAIYVLPEHRGWVGMELQRWVDVMLECQGISLTYRERPVTTGDLAREARRGPLGYHLHSVLWVRNLAQPERERIEVASGT